MKNKFCQITIYMFMVLAMCQGYFYIKAMAKDESLRVAFKSDMPYYQFQDENGEAVGLHIDMMNAIAREMNRNVVYFPTATTQEGVELLQNGEVDILLGIPHFLEGDFITSAEINSGEIAILAKKSFINDRNLKDIPVFTAAVEQNASNQFVINNLGAVQNIIVGSQKRVLEAHLEGRADLMVCDISCMEYLLREKGIWDEYVVVQRQVDEFGYTMAVRSGEFPLRRELENQLIALRMSTEYEQIRSKWIRQQDNGVENLKRIIYVLGLGSAVIIVVLGGYVYLSRRIRRMLEKEVQEKTRELDLQIHQLSYESELRNRIIERSPNGMVLIDWNGKITLINQSACKMADITKTVIGTGVYEIAFFKKLFCQAGAPERRILLQGVTEKTIVMSEDINMERIYLVTALPTYRANLCNGALITVEDITSKEEQRMAVAEKEKNQVMNRLIAGIAHEIKNPLTGIRNFAELIATKRDDPKFLDYFAALVPAEVDRISRLTESLMQYARPPRGRREVLNLTEVVRECVILIQPSLPDWKEITLKTEVEDNLMIFADRDQMKQVIINLFMNGIGAVERKIKRGGLIQEPALKIVLEGRKEYVIVQVMDKGDGMTPEEIEKCTEPFFTTSSKGNGLGLAMSKRFIQENEGVMRIESEKGVGTCFTIRFRRCEDEKEDTDYRR